LVKVCAASWQYVLVIARSRKQDLDGAAHARRKLESRVVAPCAHDYVGIRDRAVRTACRAHLLDARLCPVGDGHGQATARKVPCHHAARPGSVKLNA